MLAQRNVTSRGDDGSAPSVSSTRASPPVTRAAPTNDGAPTRRDTHGHAAGDVVDGRYILIEQLGKGGMGVVWKARSTALDVEVAVKLVRSSPNPSADAFKRMA